MKQSDDLGLFNALIAGSAASGNVATVPDTQTTAGDGSASIALGFPPETFIDRAAGGSPPRGADMNGFLNRLSRAIQVLQAGYFGPFNSAFAQAIGGYPAGSIVSGSTPGAFWVSTADNNVTTPGASGATWQSLFAGYLTESLSDLRYVQQGQNLLPTDTPAATAWLDLTTDPGYPRLGISGGNGQTYGFYGVAKINALLSTFLSNTNPGIPGALTGTSLCVSATGNSDNVARPKFAYNNNTEINTLAWYSDVTAEATARTNADNNLQSQISAKMDSSFAASGIITAGGAAGNGTIAGGTWLRVGNTLTQSFTVENISSGTITFPVAFSGSDDQVTCIFQTADGSASTFRPGQITTTSATFHSPGGGGASRMTVQAQGPYGT